MGFAHLRIVAMSVLAGIVAAALFSRAGQAQPVSASKNGPIVTVAEGPLRGLFSDGVSTFLGVPYAAPSLGAARWTPPRPALAHDGIRSALAYGPSCPQPMRASGGGAFMMWSSEYQTPEAPGISEDCLFANIWSAAPLMPGGGQTKLPVLLFLHGGAYFAGSGSVPIYDGANMARKGLVVVTINYRIGALGFMAHPELSKEQGGGSGNYGIEDQIEALRWIKRNIAAFGGDPDKVTIAGQSAGGGSVLALMAAPSARNLFRAAVVQSVPLSGNFRPLAQAEETGIDTLRGWGVGAIAEARELPVNTLLKPLPGPVVRFLMTADGNVVPVAVDSLPLASDVPVIVGYTLNDLFIPPRSLTPAQWQAEANERYGAQAKTFLRFFPGRTQAEATDSAAREDAARTELFPILKWIASTRIKSPVYAYLFSHVEPGPDAAKYRAFHSSELPYEFDTFDQSPGRNFNAVDRRVSDEFSGAIVNFAKTLSPAGGLVRRWPAMAGGDEALVEFGDKTKVSRVVPVGADDVIAAGKPYAAPRP